MHFWDRLPIILKKSVIDFASRSVGRCRRIPAIVIVVVLTSAIFCIQMRCIHLRADTPENVSNNIGIYVDEGYKTLAPRNLVLFESTRAHPADAYGGWLKASPLTNWPYYFIFKWFGVEIENARLVTIAYFALFILLFVPVMAGRYKLPLLLIGIFALSLQHTLFFFSRVALLEVPIVTLLYGCLFLFVNDSDPNDGRIFQKAAGLGAIVFLGTFGVKLSALIYFFIAGTAGFFFFLYLFSHHENKKKVYAILAGFIVLAGIGAVLYFDFWWPRVGHSVFSIIIRALNSPLAKADVFLLITGVLCGLHGLVCQPKLYLGNFYRASLIGLVFLGPLLLSVFPYNPLRYYVPLLPAYILLILEWFYLRTWREPLVKKGNRVWAALTLGMLFYFVYYFGVLFNDYVIKHLPIMIGDEPGLSDAGMVRFFAPVAVAATLGLFIFRKRLFSGKIFVSLIVSFALMGLVYNVVIISRFAWNPSYQSRRIQTEMETIVPDAAIVAGDWAPFFCIGTKIRSVYMNNNFNRETIGIIRPDFFLDSGNQNSRGNALVIRDIAAASLGAPVMRAEYAGSIVTLYPVLYDMSTGM